MGIQSSQEGMGAVQAAVLAFGLEWLSALIPLLMLLVVSVCCIKKHKKKHSSQLELPMTEARPEPVGEVQNQVQADPLVTTEQIDTASSKDFILVVDEQ
jgi:hypothetical protein